MKDKCSVFVLAMLLCMAGSVFLPQRAGAALKVSVLRTEAVRNPSCIDTDTPVFSWVLDNTTERGVSQVAYELTVYADASHTQPLWTSGKVESTCNTGVAYGGGALQPHTRYYWSVTVWDNKGNEAASTEQAYFDTGLMGSGWQGASWIKATTTPLTTPGGEGEEEAITAYRVETDFEIDNLAAGVIFATADDKNYFMWQVNMEAGYPRFRPHAWRNGTASCLAELDLREVMPVELHKTYHLRIDVEGKTARTYIDDVLVDTRTNPYGEDYVYGRFGIRQDRALYNYNDLERAYFDNFSVSNLSSGTPQVLWTATFDEGSDNPFGNGTVTGGRLMVEAMYAWYTPTTTCSYDLDLDVTVVRQTAGIVFSAYDMNNMHMWSINLKDKEYPFLRRHIRKGGNYTYTDVSLESLFSKAELLAGTHHVKIGVRGQVITTTIDGKLADTYTDTSGTLHLGLLGFRSYHDTTMDECAIYDNVVLISYAGSAEGQVVFSEDFQGAGHAFLGGTIVADGEGGKALAVASTYEETCVMQDQGEDGIPVFRKEFTVDGEVRSARLYATAMGVFDVFVNGQRVGNPDANGTMLYDELKPGWTDYRKEVNYLAYDVTALLNEGGNAVGAQVSNGWWNGAISRGVYGNTEPGLLLMLRLEYADGTVQHVVTGDGWHCSTCGPVLMGDIYNGERYDARRNMDWCKAGYDDASWCQTAAFTGFGGEVTAFCGPTVRVRQPLCRTPHTATVYSNVQATGTTYGQIEPLKVVAGDAPLQLKAGQTVIYDMAQNMVGWVRFTAKGERGTRLRFRFGEMLNDNGAADRANDGPGGSLYTYNLRTAEATLDYIMNGEDGGESFNPSTSFFGFRYCEVTTTADVEICSLQGQVVGSDIEEVGTFECSHPDVNQLYSNVMWGQRSNFLSIPTDCPQRDERLGWTGDTQIFSRAACYNADARAFYHKWMGDLRNGQRADGAYPDMAPYCNFWGYGNAAWGDAGVIVPWTVYSMYGDTRILADNYASMTRYMDFLAAQSGGGFTYNGAGTSFGDWLAYEDIDARYVSVCYYAYVAGLMGRIAHALSANETDSYALDAAKYEELAENIKAEFQQRYITSGYLSLNTQTAYLLALAFDLLPADRREAHITMLRNKITSNGYKLSTGFVGTGLLNQTLSQVGLNDYAYDLLLQRDNPSWLYSIDQGATTIWERWDSYTKEGGFNKHPWIMNSFNHYAYGVVSEWLFRYVGGIDTDDEQPGFRHFVLRPTPDWRTKKPEGQATITQAKATHRSPHGLISSEWQTTEADAHLIYKVTVPVGTTATLLLPLCEDTDQVTEGGQPLDQAEGIDYKGVVDGKAVMELASGVYEFATAQGSPNAMQQQAMGGLTVTPKPFGNSLHIGATDDVTSVLVTDSNGKVMHSGTSQCDLDTAAWSRGLYVISVTTPNHKYVDKAMKW